MDFIPSTKSVIVNYGALAGLVYYVSGHGSEIIVFHACPLLISHKHQYYHQFAWVDALLMTLATIINTDLVLAPIAANLYFHTGNPTAVECIPPAVPIVNT
jgi:cell shape-determining protein MreD